MKIIDFHTQVYPEAIAQKAAQSICDFYELEGGGMDGTVSTLLSRGKQAGISQFVVLPVGLKPGHVAHINDFVAEQCRWHSEFYGFGTLHAAMEDITGELSRVASLGLKGIKFHPDTQLFDIDDERLFPVYEMMQGKMPLMLHMGDKRYNYSHPARLRRVLELFPRLQVIAAHFGGYSMYDEAMEQLYDKDCFMDISSSLMVMSREKAVELINRYGAERLVYGTDFPLWDPMVEVPRFLDLPLSLQQQEQIAYKTAESIFQEQILL